MIYKLLEKLYRLANKIVPIDITKVLYLLPTDNTAPSQPLEHYTFQRLSAEEVLNYSQHKNQELKPEMASLIDSQAAICIAALIKSNDASKKHELAAYIWFASGNIDARHNSAGAPFKGIALALPANTYYLFKAYVTASHRGQALNSWIIHHACDKLLDGPCDAIITTTDWANTAFQKSAARSGFKTLATAAESVLFERHFFKLPRLPSTGVQLLRGP